MIAGRYTLVSEVGRGGMGVVWRGIDQLLERDVALKRVGMIPGGVSPDLARAEREARLAASLNHPNVVAVFDLVTEGDEQWLVMEYVENRTLAQLVHDQGPLGPDQAAGLLHQAASGLAAAHQAGIVHRDVKPSNILVTPDGRVKLTDFGIARAHADVTLTQTGLMSGSPAYLAPEVATGQTATAASDVWALGATAYHALTGRPPFEVGSNVMGALYQIVHSDPPRPENAGWLLPLLEATMAKSPGDRWSMAEVRDFLTGPERRAAAPSGSSGRDRTLVMASSASENGSRRWLLPLLLVAALALVVGLGLWAMRPGDGARPSAAAGDDRSTSSASRQPDDASSGSQSPTETSTGSPTDSPTDNPADSPTDGAASADGMTGFVDDYLSTVTSDPRTTWGWLTPGFQDASDNFGRYKGFWSTISSAEPSDIEADPEEMTVSYHVTYTRTDGSVVDDDVTLQLALEGDQYYIAGES